MVASRHLLRLRGGLVVTTIAVFAFVLGAADAKALDYNDVRNLVSNKVSEQVILNMLQQSNPVAVTNDQANELRRMGASETLIAGLRSMGGTTTAAATPAPQNWSYVESDGSGSVPSTVVVQPSTSPQVVQTYPSTTTYVDPNVTYYDTSGSVIVTSPPTVVYETPTYVEVPTYTTYPYYYYPSYPYGYRSGSSWSFSFGFGDGGRYGRHGGGGGHRGGGGGHRGGGGGRRH